MQMPIFTCFLTSLIECLRISSGFSSGAAAVRVTRRERQRNHGTREGKDFCGYGIEYNKFIDENCYSSASDLDLLSRILPVSSDLVMLQNHQSQIYWRHPMRKAKVVHLRP